MFFTLTTFTSVQIDIWDMLTSARDSCTDNEQRRRLNFLRNITPPIWMTFGVCWHLEYFGLISIYNAEMVVLWGNFFSKVHSIRRLFSAIIAQEIAEHTKLESLYRLHGKHSNACDWQSVLGKAAGFRYASQMSSVLR